MSIWRGGGVSGVDAVHHHDPLPLHLPSPPAPTPPQQQQPPAINFILSFLLVGLAWGLTTPFIRRAARDHRPPPHPVLASDAVRASRWKPRVYGAALGVADLLRNPRYAVPLVLNLTGKLSLTVPIVNTVAFLFTVVGEWWVEGKVISRDTLLGMLLSVGGIALCVHSKNVS
ncbi:hypothetical protein NEMBOFW57_006173 [Staphylotrichum longicolle]|uniref:Integral membrane protein n=1 Tax=Staphylotrichum longicolle TaxID=669026 RepID=A0AAD4EYF1_9PEZI|nr:hypothetical protein NEMBOFW57_006173 [Staphylotrichum longicolle]